MRPGNRCAPTPNPPSAWRRTSSSS
jgi:hypothetical protein